MTISEMHVWFRQYAQQAGMQNVRSILPEQIDIFINTSISDTANQIIKETVGLNESEIVTDSVRIGQVNALSSLYKTIKIDMSPSFNPNDETRIFSFNHLDRLSGKMTTDFPKINNAVALPKYLYILDFSLNYKTVSNNLGYTGDVSLHTGKTYNLINPSIDSNSTNYAIENLVDGGLYNVLTFIPRIYNEEDVDMYKVVTCKFDLETNRLFYVDDESLSLYILNYHTNELPAVSFILLHSDTLTDDMVEDKHINMTKGVLKTPIAVVDGIEAGYVQPTFADHLPETKYFPVRLVDDTYLANIVADNISKNRITNPIMTTYNGIFDLYIDEFKKHETAQGDRYVLDHSLIPYKLKMSYIAAPAVVKYASDIGEDNVDCDLPEYLHVNILKHAVELFALSISKGEVTYDQPNNN